MGNLGIQEGRGGGGGAQNTAKSPQ
jgi:hypothetical protein